MRSAWFTVAAASLSALSALSLGCGMITGLSNDYQFVPDDAGAGGGSDASDGGGTSDDGSTSGDGGKCDVPTGVIACGCLPKSCCALAACFSDPECAGYAQCRTACGRSSSEVCLKACENKFPNGRDQYDSALGTCNVAQSCRNFCAL